MKQDDHRERLADEMADVLYFLLLLADNAQIDLAPSLERKLLKNEQKYPISLAYGKNAKYSELKPAEPHEDVFGEGVGTEEPPLDPRSKRRIDLG